jgi:hypothetical protein
MANPHPDPLRARLAKKRRRRAGGLPQLTAILWKALLEAESVLQAAEEPALRLRAVHALSQCAGQYAKLLEIGELEARIQALEQGAQQQGAR